MSTTARLTLAIPIDAARMLDHTTTQTQITNSTFQGTSDDRDMLESYIEDAEDEYRKVGKADVRLSRAGTPGSIETYDQVTYQVDGHPAYKGRFTGVWTDYDFTDVTKGLSNQRVLPFDSTEGDEAYIFRGLDNSNSSLTNGWEEVTDDEGDIWQIVDYYDGTVMFDARELRETMFESLRGLPRTSNRMKKFRFAITYRYGALGGNRDQPGQTTLTSWGLSDNSTGTESVDDASRLPTSGGGAVILLIGSEYVRANVDASADEIDVIERGVRGSSATTHASGDRVQYTPPVVRKAVAARAGMQLIQSGRYSGFSADVDDDVDRNDVLDRLQQTWEMAVNP